MAASDSGNYYNETVDVKGFVKVLKGSTVYYLKNIIFKPTFTILEKL